MMDPEEKQAFEQAFGFAFLDDRDELLPLVERIILLKLGTLAWKVAGYQNELAKTVEKAKTELSPEKCLTYYNEATDVIAQAKRAEAEFQGAVEVANSTKKFTFNDDYTAYPSPVKNTTEEKGTVTAYLPAVR